MSPVEVRQTTDWDVSAEHHHSDGSMSPMAEIAVELGEPSAAFSDLVANQTRTFRCACGETVSVDLLINMKREFIPEEP